jgi:glucose-1-phosphate adenylyltransferase
MMKHILNLLIELQGVQEAERPSEGFYIRSGVTVVLKNSIIEDGLVI